MRRTALPEPRIEMAPLLDVIFLLLTFFIYSLVMTVRASVLPINLPNLTTGEATDSAKIATITVDAAGRFYFNGDAITWGDLEAKIKSIAALDEPPAVFLALDTAASDVDRGPILIDMIELMRKHGVKQFNIVGQPDD